VSEAIFGALAPVIPDKVLAGSGTFWGILVSGRHPDGRPFNASMLPNGGMGGSGRKGGLPTTAYPWNSIVTPTEIFENQVPLCVERKELLPDSAGGGRFPGGFGQRIVLRPTGEAPVTVSLRPVNLRVPPPGLLGGEPACLGRVLLNGQPVTDLVVTLRGHDELVCELPGGGGFGPPEGL
jgi:N-methylhydantoinase B